MAEPQSTPRRCTPAEYFALEEQSQVKHEYFDGEVFAMAGASIAHNTIGLNMYVGLRGALQGRGCRVQVSDVRVVLQDNFHYTYPDVVVSCHPDDQRESNQLRHPTLIVEVLSASTSEYDRSDKFKHYRQLLSLRYYVLVHQDRWLVEWYHREEVDKWVYHSLDALDEVLEIAELHLRLPLADLYDDTAIAPMRLTPPPGDVPR